MFGPTRGLSGWPIKWNRAKCCGTDPCCHGNEIWARRGDPVAYRLVYCFSLLFVRPSVRPCVRNILTRYPGSIIEKTKIRQKQQEAQLLLRDRATVVSSILIRNTLDCDQAITFRAFFYYIPIEFGPTGNSAIGSADPETPSLEPNMEWIACTVMHRLRDICF